MIIRGKAEAFFKFQSGSLDMGSFFKIFELIFMLISMLPDRNSALPRIIIQKASMQNFMEIGLVVFAGECVSIKTGCTPYSTSKPVFFYQIKF